MSSRDVVIAVMGATGSGKSTFVSTLVEEEVGIGHGLRSTTRIPMVFSMNRPEEEEKISLIDTPGFNDTALADTEVLQDIAFMLTRTYQLGIRLAGIIYLHRITDNRVGGSGKRMMRLIRDICGDDAYPRVVLATTMWQDLHGSELDGFSSYDRAVQHEVELRRTEDFWGAMCRGGSRVMRWDGTRQSAMAMVDHLKTLRARKGGQGVVLQIQREMVDMQRELIDTAAGQTVGSKNKELAEKFRAEMREASLKFHDEHERRLDNDQLAVDAVREACERQILEAEKARDALKVDFDTLSRQKIANYEALMGEVNQQAGTVKAARREKELQSAEFYRDEPGFEDLFQSELEYNEARLKKLDQKIAEHRALGTPGLDKLLLERKRVDECYQEFLLQYQGRQVEQRIRDSELASLRGEESSLDKKQLALQGFGILAGIGLVVAGVVTIFPPLVAGGVSLAANSMSSMAHGNRKQIMDM
ncbi:P-loop containing nucleoside triphosphate hydrolase protein [Podospora didyma]|uniref:P-loop containing nucleoside triphosphate hydrolase protein n=1 Tax=Podospora didyma TaxID=330526 RepID=A0AAE0P4X9_9PEZI|nr:P-loop containing nucleoside triphosphate hydrolase protein [Podospora didyma]